MGDKTGIQWTEATWNPVRGCSAVSPGCEHCYAQRQAHRMKDGAYKGLTRMTNHGPKWTGAVRVGDDKLLEQPLRWRRPRMIFVNSMSDLFHERLVVEEIASVFAVMALAHWHTFQVLTKRSERMMWLLGSAPFWSMVRSMINDTGASVGPWTEGCAERRLANVWLCVSAEDQRRADERIPHLLGTPAAVRGVSCEPLLGPTAIATYLHGLDWVIVGGESGPGARPCAIEWIGDILRQCAEEGVQTRPFVKQLGANVTWGEGATYPLAHPKGGDIMEWPVHLRRREFPVQEAS